VTSETDRRGLLRLAEIYRRKNGHVPPGSLERRIAVVPNGVDLAYFSPPDGPRESQTLVISGKMSYHANITAVVRFVQGVMPKIWARLPETRLWIVGKDPSTEIRDLGIPSPSAQVPRMSKKGIGDSRVQITGTVDDVRPYLRKATISVAPIRYGAGIQNKVLEAMACGTPVIATPEAVKALHVRSDHHLVIKNEEQDLADAICSLLTNPTRCSSLGLAGRAFVEANHDWRLAVEGLSRIYQDARF
jgi:glycosyltransferase involved in cell wall biosynthesis